MNKRPFLLGIGIILGIVIILGLYLLEYTTIPNNDPIVGTWVHSQKTSEWDQEFTYTFDNGGGYNATRFYFSTEHGPHSLGPGYGTWKSIGDNKYIVFDKAGAGAGESSDPFYYSPENDTLIRSSKIFVRIPHVNRTEALQ